MDCIFTKGCYNNWLPVWTCTLFGRQVVCGADIPVGTLSKSIVRKGSFLMRRSLRPAVNRFAVFGPGPQERVPATSGGRGPRIA